MRLVSRFLRQAEPVEDGEREDRLFIHLRDSSPAGGSLRTRHPNAPGMMALRKQPQIVAERSGRLLLLAGDVVALVSIAEARVGGGAVNGQDCQLRVHLRALEPLRRRGMQLAVAGQDDGGFAVVDQERQLRKVHVRRKAGDRQAAEVDRFKAAGPWCA